MKAGHQVRRADPPYPASLGVTALTHWTAGTSMDARDLDRRLLTRRTRVHAALGRRFVGRAAAGRGPGRLRGRLEPFFTEYDVLLTPALARRSPWRGLARAGLAAQRGGELRVLAVHAAVEPDRLARDVGAVRHAGLGRALRRAVGGAPGPEAVLLELAEWIEALRPWRRTAPLD